MASASAVGSDEPRVAVIGGGVIGLSSALQLLRSGFKNVVVIADRWTPDTVSDGAGAFWERHYLNHARWARETMEHYGALIKAGLAEESGVAYIPGYQFSHSKEEYPFQTDVVNFRRATPEEIEAASRRTGERLVDGCYWTSCIVDSPTYLMWLMKSIRDLGGKFAHRYVSNLHELTPYFDLIVNCAGLAARELVGDTKMHGIRGQLIRVWAPHIKEFQTISAGPGSEWHGFYVLPRPTSGVVICGGTFQRDNECTGISREDAASIWEGCTRLVPALKDARVMKIEDWAGMRPARHGDVRIDMETIEPISESGGLGLVATRPAVVIHNIGHAGCGHSLHWGCANDVVKLAMTARPRISCPHALSTRACLDDFLRHCGEVKVHERSMTELPRKHRATSGAAVPLHARL